MTKNSDRAIEILLIEDNPGDVLLTQEAFRSAKVLNNIHVARDGEEAMAFLNREEGYEKSVRPDLILLDLNLPRVDGREVLERIKQSTSLRSIPVMVLTSSEADQDVLKAYDSYASGYIVKPISMDQFIKVVMAIENFWFSVVTLPSQ